MVSFKRDVYYSINSIKYSIISAYKSIFLIEKSYSLSTRRFKTCTKMRKSLFYWLVLAISTNLMMILCTIFYLKLLNKKLLTSNI